MYSWRQIAKWNYSRLLANERGFHRRHSYINKSWIYRNRRNGSWSIGWHDPIHIGNHCSKGYRFVNRCYT